MYLRNLRRSGSAKPSTSRRRLRKAALQRLLVEDADDGVLAVDRRHDRDAEVDRAALHAQAEAAVLGHALLRDVQLGHDLDAADDRLVVALVERLQRGVEHAVDAVLRQHLAVLGLDVRCRRRGGRSRPGSASRPGAPIGRVGRQQVLRPGRSSDSSSATSCRRSRLAGLLEQELAARDGACRQPRATRAAGAHHRLDRAPEMELAPRPPQVESSRPPKAQHQPSVLAPDGHARSARAAQGRLRPKRCVVGSAVEECRRKRGDGRPDAVPARRRIRGRGRRRRPGRSQVRASQGGDGNTMARRGTGGTARARRRRKAAATSERVAGGSRTPIVIMCDAPPALVSKISPMLEPGAREIELERTAVGSERLHALFRLYWAYNLDEFPSSRPTPARSRPQPPLDRSLARGLRPPQSRDGDPGARARHHRPRAALSARRPVSTTTSSAATPASTLEGAPLQGRIHARDADGRRAAERGPVR